MNETKLTILGTGNAMATRCYNTCFALTGAQGTLLVDAGGGNGIFNRLEQANIGFEGIRAMVLTHCHTDHALGTVWVLRKITALMKSGKYDGEFHVYAHEEGISLMRYLCVTMLPGKFTKLFDDRVIFHTVTDGETQPILGMELTFFDIGSTKIRQFGFAALLPDGKRLCCLGDEPYNPACEGYARGADLLLCEAFCLHRDADRFKPYEKHHSTALDAGRLAETLEIGTLLLYHTEDETLATRKETYTAEAKQGFSGTVLVPDDLEEFTL